MENTQKTTCSSEKKQRIFNIIIAVAILALAVILALMHFNSGSGTKKSDGSPVSVAFVNSDSVMSQYVMVDSMKSQLEKETIKLQEDLSNREKEFQAKVQTYQKKIQMGTITSDEAKALEQSLGTEQQSLMDLQQQYLNQINQLEINLNNQVLDSITNIISVMNEEWQYDYVLGYMRGAGILYANPKYDITNQVVEKLNDRYSK